MAEITLFQGVAAIVLASLPAVGWFLKIARDLEREAEVTVNEKASILDEHFIRSIFVVSSYIVYRTLKVLGETKTEGGTILEALTKNIGKYFDELLKLRPQQIEKEIEESEMSPELLSLCRLRDEDKDRFFDISFLAFQLKETVPETFSSMVDKMTKGVIFGIICGILIVSLDIIMSFNLTQYFGLVTAVVLLTGFLYFYFGILKIWTLRKLERKLKELKKEKEIDAIWETVMEISEYE